MTPQRPPRYLSPEQIAEQAKALGPLAECQNCQVLQKLLQECFDVIDQGTDEHGDNFDSDLLARIALALGDPYLRLTPVAGTVMADYPPDHSGEFVWKNGWEMVWVCSDDCPHPTHEDYQTPPARSTDPVVRAAVQAADRIAAAAHRNDDETPPGDRPDWCNACRGPCKEDGHG